MLNWSGDWSFIPVRSQQLLWCCPLIQNLASLSMNLRQDYWLYPFFFFFFACNICLEYIQNCVAMACFPCELTRKGTACDGLWPWCHPPAVSVGSPPDDSSVLWFYQSAGFLVLTWTTHFSFLLLGTVSFVVNANHSFNTCFTVSSVAYTHTQFNSCLICMDISITSLYISIRSLYTFIRAV